MSVVEILTLIGSILSIILAILAILLSSVTLTDECPRRLQIYDNINPLFTVYTSLEAKVWIFRFVEDAKILSPTIFPAAAVLNDRFSFLK